jgi:hypothetical protein
MPPSFLHYEQWIGPSPYHPYSPQYFGGSAGLNCLFWNMYRDFGVGQMGDMGAHTMDLLWNAIDAGAPKTIDIDREVSDKYDPNICPVKLKAIFEHPANSWRGPIKIVWYQGGLKPDAPRGYVDMAKIPNGAIFEGTKGILVADFTSRILLPNNDDGDLTYYKRRAKDQVLPLIGGTGQVTQAPRNPGRRQAGGGNPRRAQAASLPKGMTAMPSATPGPSGFPEMQFLEGKIPPDLGMPNPVIPGILEAEKSGNAKPDLSGSIFQSEWIAACKGQSNNVVHGTSSKTHCDFDYSGTMMEQMLLGLVSHQVGKKLEYDAATGKVTNSSEANDYLKRQYRGGWTLNG